MHVTGLPQIIQGGMGVAVSSSRLARAVATAGGLGVVSGTALDEVLSRRLQLGDPDGSIRRAMLAFPSREVAERVLDAHFVDGGLRPGAAFRPTPLPAVRPTRDTVELIVVANFVEVFLAKEGHSGPVGVNYLEKIQTPLLPSLLGAMLAGVDVVLVGAGLPFAIPGVLDRLARWESVEYRVTTATDDRTPGPEADRLRLDPAAVLPRDLELPPLRRPRFLAIVASEVAARTLLRRATGHIDGFVVEGHGAGGHNAPPRGGRDEFGPRDRPNLETFRRLGRPFWLAGGQASPRRLRAALAEGAEGIQVGTAFALSAESGMLPELKADVLTRRAAGTLTVRTDLRASPTGYPFKLAELPATVSEESVATARRRVCDLGYLRQGYVREDGTVGFRCPGEPSAAYVRKGGDQADTAGRLCLCNGLLATVGLGQRRRDGPEPAMVTAGEDLGLLEHLPGATSGYRAADVLAYLRS